MSYLNLTPLSKVIAELLEHIPPELKAAKDWLSTTLDGTSPFTNELYCATYFHSSSERRLDLKTTLVAFTELSVPLPFLPKGTELVLAPGQVDTTEFDIALTLDFLAPGISLSVYNIAFALRFGGDILRAVDENGSLEHNFSTISFERLGAIYASYYISKSFEIEFSGFDSISLLPSMVGDSGVIISATGIEPNFNDGQLELGELDIRLPKAVGVVPNELVVRNAIIREHGFSGDVGAAWALRYEKTHPSNDGLIGEAVGKLFDAFSFGIRQISIAFERNVPKEFEIQGMIVIPALDNGAMGAVVNLGASGEIQVSLTSGDDGLLRFTKDQLFDLQANTVSVKHTAEETALTVSGDFSLTNDSVKEIIPKFTLQGFTIYKPSDRDWNFRLEGGNVEINKSIDLFGLARADLKEIGLGERNGQNVFTFSGGVQLLNGVDAGAWVEGLRVEWKDGGLTLDGIGLRVVVPDTFEFQGSVVKKEEAGQRYFEGAVDLNLIPAKIGMGAALKIGRNAHCSFAFLSADLCLPGPGIPLGTLPLYIRCIGGLIGVNTTPDAQNVNEYFALAKRAPAGLKHPAKWRDQCGSHAIGLSATIATANPKLFNMEALLAFVYPELLLLIEGQASILEEPKPGKTPPFHALMAFDIDRPSALINLSAQYDFAKILTVDDAMLEVYYGPDSDYYFALGQQKQYGFPADRPVSTKTLQLFSSMSYLILKPKVWALGATIGLPKKKYSFSVASVQFEAVIKGEGEIHWGPEQFTGNLSLSGSVGFRLFKKGFDLWLDADVTGKTPDWLVDALLKFGVKFKVLRKKVKFQAQIPFHWEHRITPPVPELLKEILLQDPATGNTQLPYIQRNDASSPSLENIPQVEPASIPSLTFNYPVDDRTGLPFGQDVSGYLPHRSGDYTFHAELPAGSPGNRGIEMYRMKIANYPNGAWEGPFLTARESSDSTSNGPLPVLYGAWQATKAPDGTGQTTHLQLFERTPFEFNHLNRLNAANAQVIFDDADDSAPSSPQTGLADNAPPVVNIPIIRARLKDFDELRNLNKPLPLSAAQYTVNEEPTYPRTRTPGIEGQCHNFLTTEPGWYRSKSLYMEIAGDVLFQGSGEFNIIKSGDPITVTLGNCEVAVDDSLPHPLRFLWIHSNKGLDEQEKLVAGTLHKAELKLALRNPVRQLTLYYDGTTINKTADDSVEKIPSLAFDAAFVNASGLDLSRNGTLITSQIDTTNVGQMIIRSEPQGQVFNCVWFTVTGDVRIYAVCYELDPTHELGPKEGVLTGYIDTTWSSGGNDAPVIPGYVYKLKVSTIHTMKGPSGGVRRDEYAAFFQVAKPPTDLTPYVLTTFPKGNGFPHYRAEEYFVRFNRNYVQQLMGNQDDKLHWEVLKNVLPTPSMPFQATDFATFIQGTESATQDHTGWGWDKANNHELTREEIIWKEAYNRSVSADQQINDDMIIPDDVIWLAPASPVLLRASFSWQAIASDSSPSIPHFQDPITDGEDGGQWAIKGDSLLHHTPVSLNKATPDPVSEANSFLLTNQSFETPYLLSVWLRCKLDTTGCVGFILAANQSLSRYLMIELNPSTQHVRLVQKDMSREPSKQMLLWADKQVGLGYNRWAWFFVRVTSISDQIAVTLELADQVLFSVMTDLVSNNQPGDTVYAGLFASATYEGEFDNLELLSLDRLNKLPLGGESYHLALYYQEQNKRVEMYKATVLASQYLDLFDHLNAWDRNVWQAQGTASSDDNILGAVRTWAQDNEILVSTINTLACDEQEYAINLRTLADLEATRKNLREARFNLDEAFDALAVSLGFELTIRPKRFEFVRANAGKGLLLQSPEPLDWTRLSAGPVHLVTQIAGNGETQTQSIDTQLIYNSDMTCAILLLRSGQAISTFDEGQSYVWTIRQYLQLPGHLEWLQKLLSNRQNEYQLTLEMP